MPLKKNLEQEHFDHTALNETAYITFSNLWQCVKNKMSIIFNYAAACKYELIFLVFSVKQLYLQKLQKLE